MMWRECSESCCQTRHEVEVYSDGGARGGSLSTQTEYKLDQAMVVSAMASDCDLPTSPWVRQGAACDQTDELSTRMSRVSSRHICSFDRSLHTGCFLSFLQNGFTNFDR